MLLLIVELHLLIRVTGVMRESCSFVYASIFQRRLTGQMVSGRDLNEMLIHVWCHQSKSKGGGESLLHRECTVAWNTQWYAPLTHPCSSQRSTVLLTYHLHIHSTSEWNVVFGTSKESALVWARLKTVMIISGKASLLRGEWHWRNTPSAEMFLSICTS